MKKGDPTDERGRQEKALRQWEKQQQAWAKMQSNLAKKLDKDPSETLPGTIHHFRLRQEELGMIDTSVPAEVKNGVSAWEMNLRSACGGVRYVQIGSSYPYPLYCPIRDAESVKPDNAILMRVLPGQVIPPRHKPVSESLYFQSRQTEFKKHIKKKFAHFLPGQQAMAVEGSLPPLAPKPIKENADIEPVVFIPYEAPQAITPRSDEQVRSRPLSAVDAQSQPQAASLAKSPTPTSQQPEGPMLMFSTAHLSFTANPGELAQATVEIDNIGSTAVFFSWVMLKVDAIISGPSATAEKHFFLSDSMNGVLLPEDEKFFTFSFRAAHAGVYSRQFELLTVPAGKERIILHLRGVVLEPPGDAVGVHKLDSNLNGRALKDDAYNLFTELLTTPVNNVLDEANVRAEVAMRRAAEEQSKEELITEQEHRGRRWAASNSALGYGFNEEIYEKILQMHANFHKLLSTLDPQHKSPGEWCGSVKGLLEDLTAVKDVQIRTGILTALNVLLRAAVFADEFPPTEPLKTLLLRSASVKAFGDMADDLAAYSVTAREMAENKPLFKNLKADKGDKKGAAKKAPAPAPPAKGAPEAVTKEPEGKPADYDALFFAGAKRIVGDAITNILTLRENAEHAVTTMCDRPLEVLVAKRLESLKQAQAAPDVEVETTLDATAKGKKK